MDPLVGLFGPDSDETETLPIPAMPASLPPEVEEGNIEYKLKLVRPSSSRFEHLVTQMKWRLQEGQGEAIYEIGVSDNGMLAGLLDEEMKASVGTLERMAERLGATITLLRDREIVCDKGAPRKKAAEILVRKVPENQQFIDLRMACLGNVDAGKSTLLGVLTQGELDNGRGRARLNLFRHLHEIQSGRTSSISHEILGFNDKGEVVNYSESRTTEEICENSTKLITLIDLAGHHKYLKTTIFGLTGHYPDFAMLVVSANTGVVGTTKEHLGFALALKVPVFVIVTKIDQCGSRQIERTVKQLERILKGPGCKKISHRVENLDDAVTAAHHFNNESITPIFTVSSVTGRNLDLLLKFFNVLSPTPSTREREKFMQDHVEHQVDEVYTVTGVGTVVAGTLSRGTLREGDQLLIGPGPTGMFHPVKALTVQRNRVPCRVLHAGQTATVSLGQFDHLALRKGMVLLSPALQPEASMSFEADIYLLYHSASYICKGFQLTVHVGNVCQTAIIRKMDKSCLRTNDKAKVVFEFKMRPEYIRVGSRLLFREGRTKGMGEVTKVYSFDSPDR